MKQKILQIIMTILLIITLTMANFLLLCVNVVSYATDVINISKDTNHKNLEFMAYFKDEKGNMVKDKDEYTDIQDLKMYFQITVKQDGYFNGNIVLNNANFRFKPDILSDGINKVDNNTIYLNQVNAGESKEIEVAIELLKDEYFDLDLIDMKSEISIEGIYKNSSQKDISIYAKRNVTLNFINPYTKSDKNIELLQNIITNKILKYGDEDKRIIQVEVKSILNNNLFPIKKSIISLQSPKISNTYPEEVLVNSSDILTTNGKLLSENNWKYNKESGVVNINIENIQENKKVSWIKNEKDKFIVTFIFNKDVEIDNNELEVNSEIEFYDIDKTIAKSSNKLVLSKDEKDSIVTTKINQNEKSIYKGKLYEGISRDITYKNVIDFNLNNVTNQINVKEDFQTIGEQRLEAVYKTSKISKSNIDNILGEKGILEILNASNESIIATINKDTQANENGYIVVSYPSNVNTINFKFTSIDKIGKLEIENTKTINSNDIGIVKSASDINLKSSVSYIINNNETKLETIESNIELKETETSAELQINRNELSAMMANNNVEFRIILNSREEKDELLKNPVLKLELPKKIEEIKINSVNLLYEDELKIKSTNLKDNIIEIELEGEQTRYKEEAIEGAILIINANLITSKKVSSSNEKVKLTYTSENAKNYKQGLDIGQEQIDIKIISHVGLITVNKISDYGIEVINNEGNKTAKLKKSDVEKQIEIKSEIINNVGSTINNVSILGVFPTKDAIKNVNNIESNIINNINVQGIDSSRVKIYYSNNADATRDLENVSNLWKTDIEDTKNIKKYLVVIDKLDVYEELDVLYNVQIPAGLEYNAIAENGYDVSYINAETGVTETNVLDNIVLETGKGPVVETTLKAYVGSEEAGSIKEGDIVTYSITVANTGTEDAQNINTSGKIPENTSYVKANEMIYEMTDEESQFTPFSTYEDVQDIGFDLQKLEAGKSVTKRYQVKVDDDTKGKTISNEIVTTYGEVSKKSNQVLNEVENGDLRLELYSADNTNGVLKNSYLYRYVLKVRNVSNEDKRDIRVNINSDDIIDIQEIFYMTSDNDSIIEDQNKYIDISNLKAGEEIEVCISVKAKVMMNEDTQSAKISANVIQNDNIYYSNAEEITVIPINLKTTISSENSDNYVNEGDIIEYKILLNNASLDYLEEVKIENTLSSKTTLVEVTKNGDVLPQEGYLQDTDETTGEDVVKIFDKLDINEQAEYKVKVAVNKIPGNASSVEIKDNIDIYSDDIQIKSEEIKHILGPESSSSDDEYNNDKNQEDENQNNDKNNIQGDKNDKENNDNNNQENNDNGNTNSSDVIDNKITKSISGTVWIDENEDGGKDLKERLLSGIDVRLLDTKTNTFVKDSEGKELVVKTNESGFYSFDSIIKGEYIVVFEYDTAKYILTAYEKNGIDKKNTSKAINRTISISGTDKIVAVTEIIKIDGNNISNINLGLQNAKNFDLKLDKYISKVVIQNSKGTSTKEYTNTTFAKAEIDAKLMSGTTAIVEYTIKVTNVGDTEAYVRKIADYISKDYKFTSDLNKDWYQSGSTLYNSSLANQKLLAGESKEIKLVVTKQMTESNTGLVNNTAEIVESYNELGLKDSTKNNKGVADLILSIKTGQIATTIGLVFITVIVICMVAYVIIRYGLKRRII